MQRALRNRFFMCVVNSKSLFFSKKKWCELLVLKISGIQTIIIYTFGIKLLSLISWTKWKYFLHNTKYWKIHELVVFWRKRFLIPCLTEKILMLQRFMIRRLKSEVLSQLPSKQRQMIVLDPSLVKSKSREMQNQARQMSNTRSGAERHGLLLQWYHTTAYAKSAAVQDYIKDLVENGRKFICFAHHNTVILLIAHTHCSKS